MDYYVVLGVSRTATVVEVKRAYRKLARRFHPDINPGDHVAAVRFKEITEAYETLGDAERRRRYDLLGYQDFDERDRAYFGRAEGAFPERNSST